MGFLGSLFSANQGSGYNAVNPTNPQDIAQAQQQAQASLAQQQQFAQAAAAQNGLGNQQAVFNQLQGVANGTGPNPAQAQLAQSTGQNVANQAALMAGQRNSGANAGLIARQAGQQGGALQQNAAGQAATLQAQQSLGALNQLGGIAGQQVGQQATANTNVANTALGNQSQLLGAQQGVNQANAGVAAVGSANQGTFLNNLLAGGGMVEKLYADGGDVSIGRRINYPGTPSPAPSPKPQMMADGGVMSQSPLTNNVQLLSPSALQFDPTSYVPTPMVQAPGPTGSSNPANPSAPQGGAQHLLTGLIKQGGQSLLKGFTGGGGGANVGATQPIPSGTNAVGANPDASSSLGAGSLDTSGVAAGADAAAGAEGAVGASEGSSGLGELLAANGGRIDPHHVVKHLTGQRSQMVPALVSPEERYLPPKAVKEVAEGKKSPMKAGEKIPGKAKVEGNSYANDTVHKKLTEGGIVLPRSVTKSSDPDQAAIKFIAAVMAKHGRGLSTK